MRILKKYKKRLWWGFCGLCYGMSPYIFHLAEVERGYKAIGGEVFILFVPIIIWMIHKEISDSLKEARRSRRNTYKMYGCQNRKDYLYGLAIKYNLDTRDVTMYAEMLGKAEDFDVLPIVLEQFVLLKVSQLSNICI